jgi:hypothetical protein
MKEKEYYQRRDDLLKEIREDFGWKAEKDAKNFLPMAPGDYSMEDHIADLIRFKETGKMPDFMKEGENSHPPGSEIETE